MVKKFYTSNTISLYLIIPDVDMYFIYDLLNVFSLMRTYVRPVIVGTVLLMAATAAHAQWTRVKLGNSDFVPGSSVFIDGSVIYIGSAGSVYRSTDGAETFTRLNEGITDGLSSVTDMTKVGNRVYAAFGGNGGRGVYYTTNQGDAWVLDTAGWAIMPGIPTQMYARRLHSYNNTHLLAILETNFTIYKSITDDRWTILPTPDGYKTPADIYVDGDTIFVSQPSTTIPATAWTTDFGATWNTRAGTGPAPQSRIYRNRSGRELYSSFQDYAQFGKEWLLRSTNNGAHWDTILPRGNTAVTSVYAKDDLVVVSYASNFSDQNDTTKKVMMSTDKGTTWTDISGNFKSHLVFGFHPINALDVYGDNLLIAGIGLSTGIIKRQLDIGPSSVMEQRYQQMRSAVPTPTTDVVFVRQQDIGGTFTIRGIDGSTVTSGTVVGELVDVSTLPKGAYVLTVQSGNAAEQIRLLKY